MFWAHRRHKPNQTSCSQHEGQVQVLVSQADVNVAKGAAAGHVVEEEAGPHEVADEHNSAATVALQAPDPSGRVLGDGVQEVNGSVQLGLKARHNRPLTQC